MPDYNPPLQDMQFLLNKVIGLPEPLDEGMAEAVLTEAGKLASEVLAPLNKGGDHKGNVLKDGAVTTAPGFKDAYHQYCAGGWNGVPFSPDHGGQGLPWLLSFPIQEMWQSANMSFGLCPLLNQGAVEAIETHGSDYLKETYLAKLISGEWTGTMNLTEPQAGSDLALLRAKAERVGDGTYKISGQKIFITYGEHDFTDNIVHLVLARLPDAPEGTKGISLFVVPKFLPDGTRNDVTCVSLEHKLGIHASPTCTMAYGDKGGAIGWVVGQENDGLKCMFTMMNNARLSVGLQGVAIAERAYQGAVAYANDRTQGKSLTTGATVKIADHPDIKRMLLSMRAQIEACRALAYDAANHLDRARAGDTTSQARVDLLTPIVKAWSTDMAVQVTSTGVQVHGGMGFIEETGAAQFFRDARILPIYEGTNGIQAADLIFRKIIRDQGAALKDLIMECKAVAKGNARLTKAIESWEKASVTLAGQAKNLELLASVSVPYLALAGIVLGGVMMERSRVALQGHGDASFAANKRITADFYQTHILPQADAWAETVITGAEPVLAALS